MPRVSHIYVEVQITEDDGTITTHEASGLPVTGHFEKREPALEVNMVPRHQTQIRRSTGQVLWADVVDVRVHVDALLVSDGRTRLFGVDHEGKPVLTLTES